MPANFSIDFLLRDEQPKANDATKPMAILEGRSLWKRFHQLGTEMIVTKSGRRMFPTLQVSFANLNSSLSYSVMVDLESLDDKRYRYSFHQSKWTATGPGESQLPGSSFVHPDSPSLGVHWMRGGISFDKLKLTNNQLDDNGHIIVNSMHRYRPRIHLVCHSLNSVIHSFSFPETAFIAVTAYQNHRITSLKIESNPFAKGFRECDLDESTRNSLPVLFPLFSLSLPRSI